MILMLYFLVAIISVTSCYWQQKSEFANCSIVEKESDYIGKNLKAKSYVSINRVKLSQCSSIDAEIDKGDGASLGKVRWVQCLKGPDCDEAGMN